MFKYMLYLLISMSAAFNLFGVIRGFLFLFTAILGAYFVFPIINPIFNIWGTGLAKWTAQFIVYLVFFIIFFFVSFKILSSKAGEPL